MDLYETEYGIYNHLNAGAYRPIASVAYHESEDFNTGSRLEETMEKYIEFHIQEFFQLSFLEFVELPNDIIAMMYEIANKHLKKRKKIADDIEGSIDPSKQKK